MLEHRWAGKVIRSVSSAGPLALGTVVAATGLTVGGLVTSAPWDLALQTSGACPGPIGIVVFAGAAPLVQISGAVPRSVTGLPAVSGYAVVTATGAIAVKAVTAVTPSDLIFGTVDAGILTINMFPGLGSPGWRLGSDWTGQQLRLKLQGELRDSSANAYHIDTMWGGGSTNTAQFVQGVGASKGTLQALQMRAIPNGGLRNGVRCPNLLITGDITVGATVKLVGEYFTPGRNSRFCIVSYHGSLQGNCPWAFGCIHDGSVGWRYGLWSHWQYGARQSATSETTTLADATHPSCSIPSREFARLVFRRTVAATSTVDFWVNGAKAGTVTGLTNPDNTAAGDDRVLGLGKRSGVDDFWDGEMFDIQVANRALSDAEIVADWNAVHG